MRALSGMIRLATLAALVGVATAQFCTDAVPGAVVFSDHDAANNGRHSTCTADQTADFPDAAYYVLSNGDTAWASSNYGTGCSSGVRDAAQAFDGSTNGGWNWAFHGACHQGDDWRTTSVRLRYSWQTGGSGLTQGIPAAGAQEETVAAVSVFQTPAGHSTGRVEVHFLAPDGTVQPVTNPSSAGFESTAPGTELQITFDAVRTSMIEIQMWAHDDTGSDICVGAAEVAICGLLTSDCAGEWACTGACEAGADRVWAESVPQAGDGAACPTAPPPDAADCASGEGACVLGCTDETATNHDATATRDDGSCVCHGFRMMQHGHAVCASCNGDMDGNEKVDVHDIMLLLGDFGLCDPRLISDGNNDGCVGVQDLMLLLAEFGRTCFYSRLLSVGGFTQGNIGFPRGALSNTQIYDPRTDTWTQSVDMINARSFYSMGMLGDKPCVCGGYQEESCEYFDMELNGWQLFSTADGAPRWGHAAVWTADKMCLVGGGIGNMGRMDNIYPDTHCIDPQTMEWTRGPDLLQARRRFSATTVNGIAYAIGGNMLGGGVLSSMESLDLNDPAAVWTSVPGAMPRAERDTAAASTNNKIFVIPLEAEELMIFDIETSTWSTASGVPSEQGRGPYLGIIGTQLVVAGGYRRQGQRETTVVQIYDVESETWTTGSDMVWGVCGPSPLLPIP